MNWIPSSATKHRQEFEVKAVALDVGCHGIRSIRRERLRLVSRSHRTCYTLLPASEAVEEALGLNHVEFTRSEDGLIVPGDAAIAAAATMGLPILNALPSGRAPKHDLVSRQILSLLVDSILCDTSADRTPPLRANDSQVRSTCVLSVSSADAATEEFFAGLTQLKGWQPILLNAGTGAGLATLQDNRLTGVTIDAGASCCTITVLHSGREVVSKTVHKGGQLLDANFFRPDEHVLVNSDGNTYRDDEAARQLREAYSAAGAESPVRSRLAGHQKLARELAETALDLFEKALVAKSFVRPTPVSIVGGLANDRYFVASLVSALQRIDTACYFCHPPAVNGDEFTIARGLLLAAEAESERFPAMESCAA